MPTVYLFMRYLCAVREGPPWDRERTRQISQFSPRSVKHPRRNRAVPSPSVSREFLERPRKYVPRDVAAVARRAKRRSKKSGETESVYIGIQWLRLNCGFSRRAKMGKQGRAERENSSKRNPGFGPTAVLANPLKKYGYILYHFLLVFKRSFLSLPRFLLSARPRARMSSARLSFHYPVSRRSHVKKQRSFLGTSKRDS